MSTWTAPPGCVPTSPAAGGTARGRHPRGRGTGKDSRSMVIVMAPDATPADVEAVVSLVTSTGGEAFVSSGISRTIIGLVGDIDLFATLNLRGMRGVSRV